VKRASRTLLPLRRQDAAIGDLSDDALLAACATGDLAALGALFDRFHVAVYRFLARLAAEPESRDDLVQATFLEVQRSAAKFRARSAVKTWILGVAANLARHHLRSESRRLAHLEKLADSPVVSPERPDEAFERRQFLGRVGAALATLPRDLRIAFVLCDVEEVPGADAARVLGIPEGTLWRRLHEARRAMRGAMEGSGG